jgi:hypothetical protein
MKKNIFTQHYQPITPATHATPTAYPNPQSGHPSMAPENDPFTQNPSEFAPIQEYVEPEIPAELEQHMQRANPPVQIPINIPLTPTTPASTIPPVTYPNIPLTEPEIEKEIKTDVYSAIRWLAEWCLRQLKEVQLKGPPDNSQTP